MRLPRKRTAWAFFHLGFDGFGAGATHIHPRAVFGVEHFNEALPAVFRMRTQIGLPQNVNFLVCIPFGFHWLSVNFSGDNIGTAGQ